MKRTSLNIIILLILASAQFGLGQLQIETEMRPRGEFRNGYKKLNHADLEATSLITQRSRLNFSYKHQYFNYQLSIQDVRAWGDEWLTSSTGVFGDEAGMDLHQAWIEIKPGFNSAIRIGRQQFSYDDERLLARRNWNQNGLSYDAVRYRFQFTSGVFDIALTWNSRDDKQAGNSYPADRMKTLNFIYLKKSLPLHLDLSLLGLASGYTANDTSKTVYLRATYGVNLTFAKSDTRARLAGYYQNGKNKTGRNISAYLLSADIKQKIKPFLLALGAVVISGQDANRTSSDYRKTDHLFDIHYGARHKYYGVMDYFSNMPKSTGQGGLIDLVGSAAFVPAKNSSVKLEGHRFLTHSKAAHPDPAHRVPGRALGTEFDLILYHSFLDHFNLKGGYSVMLPEKNLEIIQGLESGSSRRSEWLWAMLTFKYALFGKEE